MKLFWGLVLVFMAIQLGGHVNSYRLGEDLTLRKREDVTNIIQVLDVVNGVVKKTVENFRAKIPDPLRATHYEVKTAQDILNSSLKLENIRVDGLSTYEVNSVVSSPFNKELEISVSLPQIQVKGHYDLKGLMDHLVPLFGNGNFLIEIDNFRINASASFKTDTFSFNGIQDLDIDFDLEDLHVRSSGFMGNSNDVTSHVASDIGTGLLKREWEAHRQFITFVLQEVINAQLAPKLFQLLREKSYIQGIREYENYVDELKGNANQFVDDILHTARTYIAKHKLDPLALPDEYTGFSKRILGINFYGHASLSSGQAKGISTIHRTGNSSLSYAGAIITIAAKAGVDTIEAGYHCEATFMGVGPKFDISVTATTPSVDIDMRANITSLHITLEEFKIQDVGHIELKFAGLGILDWLSEVVGGWVVAIFKGPIIRKVENVAKEQIQAVLDDIKPPMALFDSVQRYYDV